MTPQMMIKAINDDKKDNPHPSILCLTCSIHVELMTSLPITQGIKWHHNSIVMQACEIVLFMAVFTDCHIRKYYIGLYYIGLFYIGLYYNGVLW